MTTNVRFCMTESFSMSLSPKSWDDIACSQSVPLSWFAHNFAEVNVSKQDH